MCQKHASDIRLRRSCRSKTAARLTLFRYTLCFEWDRRGDGDSGYEQNEELQEVLTGKRDLEFCRRVLVFIVL